MSVMRAVLLAGSQNAWLRDRAMRSPFVRRSVARFMPGETLDAALDAARGLERRGTGTVLTRLGENLSEAGEAEAVDSPEFRQMIWDAVPVIAEYYSGPDDPNMAIIRFRTCCGEVLAMQEGMEPVRFEL
jgi:hypothetical protein